MSLMKVHPTDYTGINPFVFETTKTFYELEHASSPDEVVASPFEIFSIEMSDGPITTDEKGMGVNIDVLFCKEITFDEYEITSYGKLNGVDVVLVATKSGSDAFVNGEFRQRVDGSSIYDSYKAIVENFLVRLQSEKLGTFNASGKSKYKDVTGQKKTYKPNNVVYVQPKRESRGSDLVSGRKIEWHHAWTVRSHYRRLKPGSKGLNRQGERVVDGATFIGTYQKGIGELIEKVRKVKR